MLNNYPRDAVGYIYNLRSCGNGEYETERCLGSFDFAFVYRTPEPDLQMIATMLNRIGYYYQTPGPLADKRYVVGPFSNGSYQIYQKSIEEKAFFSSLFGSNMTVHLIGAVDEDYIIFKSDLQNKLIPIGKIEFNPEYEHDPGSKKSAIRAAAAFLRNEESYRAEPWGLNIGNIFPGIYKADQDDEIRRAVWLEIYEAVDEIYSACKRNDNWFPGEQWRYDISISTGVYGYVEISSYQLCPDMIPDYLRHRMEYQNGKIYYYYPESVVKRKYSYSSNRMEETEEQRDLAWGIYQYLKGYYNDYLTDRLHMDSEWSMNTK